MAAPINDTHDASLRSWVDSANEPGCDFPIQNLPYGVFHHEDEDEDDARVGVAIGDMILDLSVIADAGLLEDVDADDEEDIEEDVSAPMLNLLMCSEPARWSALRRRISELLSDGNDELCGDASLMEDALIPMSEAVMVMPAEVGDYTDFYASIHHATNVGSMFRPDNPLLPNYKWIPIGYHGRSSTLAVSGTPVRRPLGQTKADDADPVYGPCKLLDYEMEVGAFVGRGNERGEIIPIDEAEDHLFGLCLVNDWSARDMQKWEYQPLGPFLAKSFLTTLSPWVVTMEALAPFRVASLPRESGDPAPLEYLSSKEDREFGGVDLTVEVYLSSERMRAEGMEPVRLSSGNFRHMYWTVAQMLTHHASNGCSMDPGDLFASGTVSGPEKGNRGCLLELTWRGSEPIELPTGETRKFLADGDEITMKGFCERDGYRRIGFGFCSGVVLPSVMATV
ncbi:FAH [Symbiodinium necroappetens]|uniref:Fumarylacetoacetase n=1 Tax=Symbiodinium necroappetens TaxID=1628268 RepID=A0A812TZ70_9DINO|nr:FAH [Symbiodinium necroappetens]